MDLGLDGKVVMVAAASKGLGYGIAKAVAAEGAKVSICSRDANAIEEAAKTIREETGAEVLAMTCDMSDAADIKNWVGKTASEWNQIDGLLVNAGGPPAQLFKETSDEAWQEAFNLTLMSTVRMIREALPHMKNGGSILVTTSASIKEPIPWLGLSTVMRAGVAGLIKTLADELAGDNIRVNNLIPGRIDTDRVAALDQNTANKMGITFEEARAQAVAKIPLGRLGNIEEYGKAAAFLLSPTAEYISGATLRVDGGLMRSI